MKDYLNMGNNTLTPNDIYSLNDYTRGIYYKCILYHNINTYYYDIRLSHTLLSDGIFRINNPIHPIQNIIFYRLIIWEF